MTSEVTLTKLLDCISHHFADRSENLRDFLTWDSIPDGTIFEFKNRFVSRAIKTPSGFRYHNSGSLVNFSFLDESTGFSKKPPSSFSAGWEIVHG